MTASKAAFLAVVVLAIVTFLVSAMVYPMASTTTHRHTAHTDFPQMQCFPEGTQGVEGFVMCPDARRLEMENT